MLDKDHVKRHCLAALDELTQALEGIKEDDVMASHLRLMIERGQFKLHLLNAMLRKAESDDPNKIEKIKGRIKDLKAAIIRDMKLTGLIIEKAKKINEPGSKKVKKQIVLTAEEAIILAAL